MKDMMKKAKRTLAYLIVLVMCVDMVSQSSFVSRAQEGAKETAETAEMGSAASRQETEQSDTSSAGSAANGQKEAEAENAAETTTVTKSEAAKVTETPKETESSTETKGDLSNETKSNGEKAAAVTDLLSRIEAALAVVIPDKGSLKGTEEEGEALNKQGENLQALYEECNEYKDIKEVAAAQESLVQAMDELLELMGLSAEMLDETQDGTAAKPWLVGTKEELAAKVAEGGYIRLTSNISLTECLTIASDKTVTLDLDGYQLAIKKNTNNTKDVIGIRCEGYLEIRSTAKTGKIVSEKTYALLSTGVKGSLVLSDGTVDSTTGRAVQLQNNAKFTMTGGTIQSAGNYAIYLSKFGGNIDISAGTINYTGSGYAISIVGTETAQSSAILSGGAIISNNANNANTANTARALLVDGANASATMSGGRIEAQVAVQVQRKDAKFSMTGGTIETTGVSLLGLYYGTLDVSGGSITSTYAGDAAVRVEGATVYIRDNAKIKGAYGVAAVNYDSTKTNTPSSKIIMTGGTVTATSAHAITVNNLYSRGCEAEISGGNISSPNGTGIYWPAEGKLTITGGTISGGTGIEAKAGTLNISGATITGTASAIDQAPVNGGAGPEGSAILLGTQMYTPGLKTTIQNVTLNSTNGYGVRVYNTGKNTEKADVAIGEGVSITAPLGRVAYVVAGTLKQDETTLTISSVSVYGENEYDATDSQGNSIGKAHKTTYYNSVQNAFDKGARNLFVYGKETVDISKFPANASLTLVQGGNVTFTGTSNNKILVTKDNNGNQVYRLPNAGEAVASVGNFAYPTLKEAINVVGTGQTVKLIENAEISLADPINKAVELDLNKKTLTITGTLKLEGKNNILKNGTVKGGMILPMQGASMKMENVSMDSNSTFAVRVGNNQDDTASLEIVNCRIEKTDTGHGAAIGIYGKSTLNVSGKSTIIGSSWGIMGNGGTNSKKEVPATTINLGSDVTVIANGGVSTWNGTGTTPVLGSSGIYHPQTGVLTTSADISGMFSGIEMRSGSLIVNGGKIIATTDTFSCHPEGSGMTTLGAAIAIAQHTTKKDISLTINGGTFKGVKALNESNPQQNDPKPQVTMSIWGGNFQGEVSVVDVKEFIYGGSFSGYGKEDDLKPYLKSGYVLKDGKVCRENKNEKHEHRYAVISWGEASCEVGGKIMSQCIFCNDKIEKDVNPLGHDWLNGKCGRCGKTCDHSDKTDEVCNKCGLRVITELKVEKKEIVTGGITVNKDVIILPTTSLTEKKETRLEDNDVVKAILGEDEPEGTKITYVTSPIVENVASNEEMNAMTNIEEQKSKPEIQKAIEKISRSGKEDGTTTYEVKVEKYLKINVYKKYQGEEETPVEETKGLMSFPVEIPNGASGKDFVVLRDHEQEGVSVLPLEYENGEWVFKTDKFSMYALASYKEEVKNTSSGSASAGSSENSGGGSNSSSDNTNNTADTQAAQTAPVQTVPTTPTAPVVIVAADPAAAPVAAVPPQPVEEEKKTQVPSLKENKTAKRKETTFGDGAAEELVTIENDETPLALGETESNWLIWILSGMSVLFAAAFAGFQLLMKKRGDEE